MNAHPNVDARAARTLPAEGEEGLYSQSWFPICLSEELTADSIVGRAFLGGRVIDPETNSMRFETSG